MAQVVLIVEESPVFHVEVPDVEEVGIDAPCGKGEGAWAVLNFALLGGLAANMADQGYGIAQQFDIVVGEANLYPGLVASGLLGSAIGKDSHRGGPETVEDILNGAGKSVAIGEQQHHGGDTPGHAQHGEHGLAQIVAHGAVCLFQQCALHATPSSRLRRVAAWPLCARDTSPRRYRRKPGNRSPARPWPAPVWECPIREAKAEWKARP